MLTKDWINTEVITCYCPSSLFAHSAWAWLCTVLNKVGSMCGLTFHSKVGYNQVSVKREPSVLCSAASPIPSKEKILAITPSQNWRFLSFLGSFPPFYFKPRWDARERPSIAPSFKDAGGPAEREKAVPKWALRPQAVFTFSCFCKKYACPDISGNSTPRVKDGENTVLKIRN